MSLETLKDATAAAAVRTITSSPSSPDAEKDARNSNSVKNPSSEQLPERTTPPTPGTIENDTTTEDKKKDAAEKTMSPATIMKIKVETAADAEKTISELKQHSNGIAAAEAESNNNNDKEAGVEQPTCDNNKNTINNKGEVWKERMEGIWKRGIVEKTNDDVKKRKKKNNNNNNSEQTTMTAKLTKDSTSTAKSENVHASNPLIELDQDEDGKQNANDGDDDDDDDALSLVIGEGITESGCGNNQKSSSAVFPMEHYISDYQSYVHPEVVHRRYPSGIATPPTHDCSSNTTNEVDNASILAAQSPQLRTTCGIYSPTRGMAMKRKLSTMTTTTMTMPNHSMIPTPLRLKKKNHMHETVQNQFDDAVEVMVTPAATVINTSRQQQQFTHQPQNSPHLGYNVLDGGTTTFFRHPYPTTTATDFSSDPRHQQQHQFYQAAVYEAQQQQRQLQQLQMQQQQPQTPTWRPTTTQQDVHGMKLLQAELDLVAAFQRVQALKNAAGAAATATGPTTTTMARMTMNGNNSSSHHEG